MLSCVYTLRPPMRCYPYSAGEHVQSRAKIGWVFDSRKQGLRCFGQPDTLAVRLCLGITASSSMNEHFQSITCALGQSLLLTTMIQSLKFVEAKSPNTPLSYRCMTVGVCAVSVPLNTRQQHHQHSLRIRTPPSTQRSAHTQCTSAPVSRSQVLHPSVCGITLVLVVNV